MGCFGFKRRTRIVDPVLGGENVRSTMSGQSTMPIRGASSRRDIMRMDTLKAKYSQPVARPKAATSSVHGRQSSGIARIMPAPSASRTALHTGSRTTGPMRSMIETVSVPLQTAPSIKAAPASRGRSPAPAASKSMRVSSCAPGSRAAGLRVQVREDARLGSMKQRASETTQLKPALPRSRSVTQSRMSRVPRSTVGAHQDFVRTVSRKAQGGHRRGVSFCEGALSPLAAEGGTNRHVAKALEHAQRILLAESDDETDHDQARHQDFTQGGAYWTEKMGAHERMMRHVCF
ncbi:unnamed protein product [Pedinophyceae sp. YPF-701]|nr:unnamed protein product [Pedinophyceae sp. YPF-701]